MKIHIEYDAIIPDGIATEDEIEEWLRFETGENGSMSTKNPLHNTPLEPIPFSVRWDDEKK